MYLSHPYVHCDAYETVSSLQPLCPEGGNSKVCRNVEKASSYDMAKPSDVSVAATSVKIAVCPCGEWT
jgi:hypothetical protein